MTDWDTIIGEEHMEEENVTTENSASSQVTSIDTAKPPAGPEAAATSPAPVDVTNEGEIKKEGPPEPGMKKCRSCGIWYPGGYEYCPSDNTKLQ